MSDSLRNSTASATPAAADSGLRPLLLRAAQAAVYCGVSEATWWRWDSAARIPRGHKVSNGVKVWRRLDLDEWAALGLPPRAEFEVLQAAQCNGRPDRPDHNNAAKKKIGRQEAGLYPMTPFLEVQN
jgi:predicted DNA-binding transcriptional regulator AlpA